MYELRCLPAHSSSVVIYVTLLCAMQYMYVTGTVANSASADDEACLGVMGGLLLVRTRRLIM